MPSDAWSNGPGAVYAPHSHPYHKTLKCERGSIEFTFDEGKSPVGTSRAGRTVRLKAGDTLEIPPGTVHSAVVGPEGCACSEVHRYPR